MLKEVQEVKVGGRTRRVYVRPFAWGLKNPSHMEWTPDGRLLVSEHTAGTVRDITKGGDASEAKPFWIDDAAGRGFFYLAVGSLGQIFRINPDELPEEITYSELVAHPDALVAWGLHRLGGMRFHPSSGLLFAVQPEMGEVIAVDPAQPGNYLFQPPVVRGLRMPTCVRFSQDSEKMYVCSSADGVVWEVEGFLT
jgi:glucose/arabinose dehydrogenase